MLYRCLRLDLGAPLVGVFYGWRRRCGLEVSVGSRGCATVLGEKW